MARLVIEQWEWDLSTGSTGFRGAAYILQFCIFTLSKLLRAMRADAIPVFGGINFDVTINVKDASMLSSNFIGKDILVLYAICDSVNLSLLSFESFSAQIILIYFLTIIIPLLNVYT